ncbi:MAG: nucleotidyl transferase AbiEii/AbiGii toxin family protein [Lentisphaerota bacterium]
MFYIEVFEALSLERIQYLLVGGLAVNLHGVPRLTYDIDIIISIDRENILRLNAALKKLGYVPRLPVSPDNLADEKILKDWIENKNMTAFSFYHSRENNKVIDIVISHPLSFSEAYARAERRTVKNIEIPIVSIDDLICMKEFAARPKDLSDRDMLIEARRIMENK